MAAQKTTYRHTWRERLFRNPVVLKELRGRMRGARAFIVLTIYLGLMSGFVTLVYLVYLSSQTILGPAQGGQIGRALFVSIVGIELFLVTFIAPAFASGAISGEVERQTYDLLRTTLLPARSLIAGKLVATLSYTFLLLLAAIPLQSIAFLFGGVSELEVILSFVILMATAILLSAAGVFFSALTRRTLSASVLSYVFALIMVVALPITLLLLMQVVGGLATASPAWEAVAFYSMGAVIATNPMATLWTTLDLLFQRQVAWTFPQTLSNGTIIPAVSPWIVFVGFSLWMSSILIVIAVRRVNRMSDT